MPDLPWLGDASSLVEAFRRKELSPLEAFEASGAKRLLLTHRPFERPLDGSLEQAHDGLRVEL